MSRPPSPRRAATAWVVLLVAVPVLLVPGCDLLDEEPAPPGSARRPAEPVVWDPVSLPTPPGPDGRTAVRDAAACEGTWYVVGGVFGADGESFPAGWTSADGATWTPLRFRARGYWAKRAVLSSVACAGDEVRVVGARSGGAHGNPRVTTWYQRPDGVFTDVVAPFELYGGPEAVSVGRIAAAQEETGWLIAGNRTAGAAVWRSTTGRDFTLVDDDPALVDAGDDAFAVEPVHDGARWVVVGHASLPERVTRVPQAWTSPDGLAWTSQDVPPTEGFGTLDRVVDAGGVLLAGGLDSDRFGLWRRTEDRWQSTARFGGLDPDGHAFQGVAGLAWVRDEALLAVSDGSAYTLWAGPLDSPEGWRQVVTPAEPVTAGDHVLSVAADGDEVLLLADDGDQGRVWLTTWE